MSFRLAQPTDHAALAACLDANLAQAMFARANLDEFGFGGTHPYACRFWIKDTGKDVTSVFALANSGMALPCISPHDAPELAQLLSGETITAFTAPHDQVTALLSAFGFMDAKLQTQTQEPQFHLSLDALQVPEGRGQIVPFHAAPKEVLLDWLTTYQQEVVGLDHAAAKAEAQRVLARNIERNQHVVLMDGDQPLAMTGLNARVGSMGQVGGVFTPAHLRGSGHARRALALHLAQLRLERLSDAVLYAASGAASNTYRAIGFREIGQWRYLAFAEPQVITCPT